MEIADPRGHGPRLPRLVLLGEAGGQIVAVTHTILSDRVHIVSARLALDDERDFYQGRARLPDVPVPVLTASHLAAAAEGDPDALSLGLHDLLRGQPLIAVRALRQHLGMSRPEFAVIFAFGVPRCRPVEAGAGPARPEPSDPPGADRHRAADDQGLTGTGGRRRCQTPPDRYTLDIQ